MQNDISQCRIIMLVIKNKIYYINVSLTVVGEDVGVLEGVDD